MGDDRAFAVRCARVYLTEAGRRRHSWVNRNFYWMLFEQAQQARRRAATLRTAEQGRLFA